jgi:hypothetical protein
LDLLLGCCGKLVAKCNFDLKWEFSGIEFTFTTTLPLNVVQIPYDKPVSSSRVNVVLYLQCERYVTRHVLSLAHLSAIVSDRMRLLSYACVSVAFLEPQWNVVLALVALRESWVCGRVFLM